MSSLQEALWGGADRLDLDEGFFDTMLRCFVLSCLASSEHPRPGMGCMGVGGLHVQLGQLHFLIYREDTVRIKVL